MSLKKSSASLVLLLAVASCAAPSVNQADRAPVAVTHTLAERLPLPIDSTLPFSHVVSPYSTLSKEDHRADESVFSIDDRPVILKNNQVTIELKKAESLDKIVKYLGARVIEQEVVPEGFTTLGSREDGTFTQLPPKRLVKLPSFLLEVSTSDGDDVSAFAGRGKRAGLTGKYTFKSNRDVSLLNKILDLKDKFKDELICAGINEVYKTASTTNEGRNQGTGNLEGSPNNSGFWFAGGRDKGSPLMYGSNLNDYPGVQWSISLGNSAGQNSAGTRVIVAVIDSGFQGDSEPYLPTAIVKISPWTWNVVGNSNALNGGYPGSSTPWHGRYVSSLIFAPWNDGKGTVGTAPEAKPLLIHTDMTAAKIKQAIDTARNNNAKVINMSIYGGSSAFWSTITPSIQAAYAENRIIVACTGNSGAVPFTYPATYSEVLGAAATDTSGNNASYSNYYDADLWAPGTSVATAAIPGADGADGPTNVNWGRSFTRPTGTSLSSPLIAGVIASAISRGKLSSTANGNTATTYLRSKAYSFVDAGGISVRQLNAINTLL